MKSSIIIAILILLAVAGWIGSGQVANVKAEGENKDKVQYNTEKNNLPNNEDNNVVKVELKKYSYSQIDQSIELQGQTIYNKKIDVKSETTGNIIKITFNRGNKVSKNDDTFF